MTTGPTEAPRAWWRRFGVVLASVAVIGLYAWTVSPAVSQLHGPTPREAYYNLQIDGFRAGTLAMKIAPDPGLARLANPYDPAQNGPYRLHDASYFNGKYHLYFGVTPALLLFLPYRLLTGHYLWHHEAVLFFCAAGFLTEVWLLCALRRTYFPGIGAGVMFLGTLGLGLANGMLPLLRRPDVWEVPVASGSWLVMLAVAALWQAGHKPGRKEVWLAAASTAFGLAVGARPTLLLAVSGLAVAAVAFWRAEPAGSRRRAGLVAAALVPVALIGAGLAFYNYARFGNILEFGQRYQLAGVEVAKLKLFSVEYGWFNLRHYLFAPVNWQMYFPFVREVTVVKPPAGHLGTENPYGVLSNVPIVWMALALPLAWRRQGPGGLRLWCLTLAVVTTACALPLFFFGGVTSRYIVDFLPGLVLLGVAGGLALEQAGAARPAWRWSARTAWTGLLVFSIAVNFFISCEYGGWLRLRDPQGFHRLAHLFDTPVAWLEKSSPAPGPLEMRLMLPPFTGRRVEPLLVTGYGAYADYIWIEYIDAGHLRIGHEHTGYGGPVSATQPVDYSREHVVAIHLGSLWPPRDHPFFDAASEAEVLDRTTTVRVELDDRVIINGKMPVYDASPWTRWMGQNPFAQHLGAKFTGRILSRRILTGRAGSLADLDGTGHIFLKLRFPPAKPPGTSEPLVVTGQTGRGDILFVRYVDAGHVVFGMDHWAYGGPVTNPLPINYHEAHRVEIRLGSLYSDQKPGGTAGQPRQRMELKLDGTVVLQGAVDFYPATGGQKYFGRNPIGGSTAGAQFTGQIVDIWRGNAGE